MTETSMTLAERMEAATLIRRMAGPDSPPERFDGADADRLNALLAGLKSRPAVSASARVDGKSESEELVASGPSLDDTEDRKWSIGDAPEARCGVYVITRSGPSELLVRQVAETEADENAGQELRIRRRFGRWRLALNAPLQVPLPGTVLTVCGFYRTWKVAA